MSERKPKFSERMEMAELAWEEYRKVTSHPEVKAPALFAAGFHLGVARAWRELRSDDS